MGGILFYGVDGYNINIFFVCVRELWLTLPALVDTFSSWEIASCIHLLLL